MSISGDVIGVKYQLQLQLHIRLLQWWSWAFDLFLKYRPKLMAVEDNSLHLPFLPVFKLDFGIVFINKTKQ